MLTGLLEVITFIGPLIAGVIVAIVALSSGGLPVAVAAVVFLFLLRQFEDVVVMPFVLGRAVNLHPLVGAVRGGRRVDGVRHPRDVPRGAGRGRDQRRAPRVLPGGARARWPSTRVVVSAPAAEASAATPIDGPAREDG